MYCVNIIVKGKVQGVFYRASAKDEAIALGVKGWIRNLENGDVEAVACGEEKEVKEFIEWCRQGPIRADVKELIITETPGVEEFESFKLITDD